MTDANGFDPTWIDADTADLLGFYDVSPSDGEIEERVNRAVYDLLYGNRNLIAGDNGAPWRRVLLAADFRYVVDLLDRHEGNGHYSRHAWWNDPEVRAAVCRHAADLGDDAHEVADLVAKPWKHNRTYASWLLDFCHKRVDA